MVGIDIFSDIYSGSHDYSNSDQLIGSIFFKKL